MLLKPQVSARPNGKVSAQGLIDVAQHDAEQKREPVHDTVVRKAVVRRAVAVQVWSFERAGRSFGPWKAQGDLALPGPLHAAIPDQRAHIRPSPRVRRKAKQPRVLNELFAKRLSVHARDGALVDTSPQRMIDGAAGAADETCRNRRRYVQESLLHEEPLLGIGERIGPTLARSLSCAAVLSGRAPPHGTLAVPEAGRYSARGPATAVCRPVRAGRSVAQPGSALDWGSRGRRFESARSDQ